MDMRTFSHFKRANLPMFEILELYLNIRVLGAFHG